MEPPGELDMLKDIPGFKAILRAVLRSQMQYLASQLSLYGEVETIILAASLTDCTLSHLSSEGGNGFLEARDDIKSQFLRHCLSKSDQNKSANSLYHSENVGIAPQPQPMPVQASKSWYSVSSQSQYPLAANPSQFVLALNQPHTVAIQPNEGIQNSLVVPELFKTNINTLRKVPKPAKLHKKIKQKSNQELIQMKEEPKPVVEDISKENTIEIKIEPIEDAHNDSESVQTDNMPSVVKVTSASTVSVNEVDTGKSVVDVEVTEIFSDEEDEDTDDANSSFRIENNVDEQYMGENMVFLENDDQDSSLPNVEGYVVRHHRHNRKKRPLPPEENVPDCEVCGTKFKNHSSYRRHIRKHTGENPWSCHLCGQGFYRKDDLNTHVMRHAGKRPYTCRLCGMGSLRLSHLRAHMVRCHPTVNDDALASTDQLNLTA